MASFLSQTRSIKSENCELLLIPKEGWRRIKWDKFANVQRPKKWPSSWEEGLSFLPEGEWAGAKSQRGITQRMRRMTTTQTDEIQKESINIFFDVTYCIRKIFHSLSNTYKDSYNLFITSRVSCSDEFFLKRLISSEKKERKKSLIPLIS